MAAAVKLGQGEPGRAWPRRKCLGAGAPAPGACCGWRGPGGPRGCGGTGGRCTSGWALCEMFMGKSKRQRLSHPEMPAAARPEPGSSWGWKPSPGPRREPAPLPLPGCTSAGSWSRLSTQGSHMGCGRPGRHLQRCARCRPLRGALLKSPISGAASRGRQPGEPSIPGRQASHRCSTPWSSSHRWPCAVRRPGQRGRGLPGWAGLGQEPWWPQQRGPCGCPWAGSPSSWMGRGCAELACAVGVTVARRVERCSRWCLPVADEALGTGARFTSARWHVTVRRLASTSVPCLGRRPQQAVLGGDWTPPVSPHRPHAMG